MDWVLDHVGLCTLVFARVLGLCLTAPGLAIPEFDWRFRLGITAALSAVLIPVVEPIITPVPGMASALGVTVEALTGGAIGWAAALILAGARLGGEIVAAQTGLSTATLLDPETGEEQTPLGRLYGWIALAVFLSLDGPLVLVDGVLRSYRIFPAGHLLLSKATTELAFAQVGDALALALRLATPPALALTLAGIVMGWLARAAPSVPLIALALPIRAVLGVALVSLSVTALAVTLLRALAALPWEG